MKRGAVSEEDRDKSELLVARLLSPSCRSDPAIESSERCSIAIPGGV